MARDKVYLETTIVSYLTGLPSRDVVLTAHQQLTAEWWHGRHRFDLFVLEAVLQEAAGGDPGAAGRRMAALQGIGVLAVTAEVARLARALVAGHAVPATAAVDAVHIAVATVNGMDFSSPGTAPTSRMLPRVGKSTGCAAPRVWFRL